MATCTGNGLGEANTWDLGVLAKETLRKSRLRSGRGSAGLGREGRLGLWVRPEESGRQVPQEADGQPCGLLSCHCLKRALIKIKGFLLIPSYHFSTCLSKGRSWQMSEVVGACVSLKSSLVISGYKGALETQQIWGAANSGLIIIITTIGNTESLLIGRDTLRVWPQAAAWESFSPFLNYKFFFIQCFLVRFPHPQFILDRTHQFHVFSSFFL